MNKDILEFVHIDPKASDETKAALMEMIRVAHATFSMQKCKFCGHNVRPMVKHGSILCPTCEIELIEPQLKEKNSVEVTEDRIKEIEKRMSWNFYYDDYQDLPFLLSTIKSLQVERDRYSEALKEISSYKPFDNVQLVPIAEKLVGIAQSALREE